MSSLFDRLKKTRGQSAGTEALAKRLEQQGQGGFQKDNRIWKHTFNDKGVTENIIRFLPTPQVDMVAQDEGRVPADFVIAPVALIIRHQFQGPNGWYVANSPQTFGEDDPVRDHDRPLWTRQKETNDEALKDKLKTRLPSTDYYANILVIKDGTVPENNGKVFLYKFGNGVKKHLDAAQNPKFSTDAKFDPFDAWEGHNFIMNMTGEKKKIGTWEGLVGDLATCKWDGNATPLADTDEGIEEIWGKAYSLYEFYDRKNFQTYDELAVKFRKVMNIPADAPLVENAAATMAHAPTSQATKPATTAQQAPANTGTGNATAPVQEKQATEPVKEETPLSAQKAGDDDKQPPANLDEFEQWITQQG